MMESIYVENSEWLKQKEKILELKALQKEVAAAIKNACRELDEIEESIMEEYNRKALSVAFGGIIDDRDIEMCIDKYGYIDGIKL